MEAGCEAPIVARRLCRRHYEWHKRRASLPPLQPRPTKPARPCAVGGCEKPSHAHGYCGMHNARWKKTGDPLGLVRADVVEAFWSRVDKNAAGGHWLWTGAVADNGYGAISTRKRPTPSGSRLPHRVTWELTTGPIPEGQHIDHLCRVKLCVNPAHLEPVTGAENTRRGLHGVLRTHCNYGHELTPENTAYDATTNCRRCRTCQRRWWAAARARKRERAASVRSMYSAAGTG